MTRTVPPTDTDLHRYSAIARRRSYRYAFGDTELSDYDVKDLIAASTSEGVQVKVLRGGEDLTALAEVLEYAALTVARDSGYQRELTLWTVHDGVGPARSTGIADGTLPNSSLPWAGLVRPNTALPDRATLAQRLERETVLVFLTPGDTRLDHLRTGIGMQTHLAGGRRYGARRRGADPAAAPQRGTGELHREARTGGLPATAHAGRAPDVVEPAAEPETTRGEPAQPAGQLSAAQGREMEPTAVPA